MISACADWSIQTDGGLAYTDHVFHFSSAFEQELLEDPTFPDPALLGKQDDVIWEPSVQALWSPSGSGTPTELGFKALGFIYTDHPIFNHGDFRLHVRQRVSPTSSIWLRYQAEPDVFLRPNFESRTGRRTIQEERVSSHIGSLEVEQRSNLSCIHAVCHRTTGFLPRAYRGLSCLTWSVTPSPIHQSDRESNR